LGVRASPEPSKVRGWLFVAVATLLLYQNDSVFTSKIYYKIKTKHAISESNKATKRML
jgi:hypothetical protein